MSDIEDVVQLKERTKLIDESFPVNLFHHTCQDESCILYNHWHEFIEIIFMTGGSAEFIIGGENLQAECGDILIVNSKLFHTGYSIKNTHPTYYAVVFDKAILAGYPYDPNYNKYIFPLLNNRVLLPSKISMDMPEYTEIVDPLKKIIRELERQNPGYELIVKVCLIMIIISILRANGHLIESRRKAQLYLKNHDSFEKVFSFIEINYANKISLEQVAKIANMSPCYFCRVFKNYTGTTFNDFLNIYRVNKAEELLKNSDLSITEVASITGFCDISYFDKVFKQIKQYTPKSSRKGSN